MMGAQVIRDFQNQAARRAARQGKIPLVVFDNETLEEDIRNLPNLGDYEPKGWELIPLSEEGIAERLPFWQQDQLDFLFVDKQGWGREGEPALTFEQFCHCARILIDHFEEHGTTIGFGIYEEGQFQVNIGVYRKLTNGRH